MLNGLGRLGAVAAVLCLSATASQAGHRRPAHAMLSHASSVHDVTSQTDRIGGLVRSVEATLLHHAPIAAALEVATVAGDDGAESSGIAPLHAAVVGDVTRVPYGWADFCTRRSDECRVDVLDPVSIVATPKVMRVLAAVNGEVNAAIEPMS